MNGAEIVVRRLADAGVRWVFGIPSGPVLPLIEALRQSDVRFVLTTSETSAGFMAATVGHLTGVPGVCVATVGPGATNLTTGVGAAWLDRAPVLALTCNVGSAWLERRIQMRIDHCALFRPLTKDTHGLTPECIDQVVVDALQLACAEPPGPVHLDLPEDVATAEVAINSRTSVSNDTVPNCSESVLHALAEALQSSRRPLLITGSGATRLHSVEHVRQFVERHHIPYVSTLHAKGVLPESHPLWCGVVGRARRTTVQHLVRQADLIIAIGYDPVEINYEEWIGTTPLIHVDWQTADVSDAVDVLLNAGGDLDRATERLCALHPVHNDWNDQRLAEHRRVLDHELRPAASSFTTHEVLDSLRARMPSDALLTYDVGAHTHQVATQWRTDLPNTCISTNGWSSMGFGMPSAYAAKLVHPDRMVVSVVGDGGFLMTAGELSVARRLNLQVPVVVLNDGWLGLMKVKQERRQLPLSGVELGPPPESPPHYFGVPCRPAHTPTDFESAFEWALSLGGPSVIEAFVDVEPYSTTVFD
jgi:acetolactate synthase I/II/III large subunit